MKSKLMILVSYLCIIGSTTTFLKANDPCTAIPLDFGHSHFDTVPCGNAANTTPGLDIHSLGVTTFSLEQQCGNVLDAPYDFVGWFTFIIREGGGSFEWQLIETGQDDVYYEIYHANDPLSPSACENISFYKCGDDFVSWQLLGVPNVSSSTRYYLALYSKNPNNQVTVNLKFRKACGETCEDFNQYSVKVLETHCIQVGESAQLSAQVFDSTGQEIPDQSNFNFLWSSSNGLFDDPKKERPMFKPNKTTTFQVQVALDNSCPAFDQANLEVGNCCKLPPEVVCPPDITLCPGDSSHIDICGVALASGCSEYTISFVDSIIIQSCAESKTIYRKWIATDIHQATLEGSCTQIISIIDEQPPQFTYCPADITIEAGHNCGGNFFWDDPQAIDNCSSITFTFSHDPTYKFPIGITQVFISATDACGNVAEHSFHVTVTQGSCCDEAPSIVCPVDYNACPGADTHPQYCGTATATGCSEYTITHSDMIWVDEDCNKVIKRTWRAVDIYNSALRDSCMQTITFKDETAPVISNVPDDIVIAAGHNCLASSIHWDTPTATDNCSSTTISLSHAMDFPFPIGITAVTVTAVDACGNEAKEIFHVTVTQGSCCDEAPSITCPADYSACPGADTHPQNCGTATATGCSEYTITHSDMIWVDEDCNKVIKRTWRAVDNFNSALSDSCMQTITFKDKIAPVISNVPDDIVIAAGHNCMASNIYWSTPTATDNCSSTMISLSHAMDFPFPIGITEVTVTAVDACGNDAKEIFHVTVTQGSCCDEAPSITCPADYSACPGADTHPQYCGTATATGCSEYTISHSDMIWVDEDCNKVIKRTWRAVDNFNSVLRDSCMQTITLKDKIAPVFANCPADIHLSGCEAICGWTEPMASDNCGTVSITSNYQPGSTFYPGTTQVTYTATDACGNKSYCSFNVIVSGGELQLECPDDRSIDGGSDGAYVSWEVPEATSCCNCNNAGGPIEGFIYMGSYNGHHYYCSKYGATWNNAQQIAENLGGYLTVIEDAQENKFVADNMCCSYGLIGLSDYGHEGTFKWINGQPLNYTNWYPYQPNDKYDSQDVVEMLKGDGRWNDAYSNCKKNFIVEIGCIDVVQISGPSNGSKIACGDHEVRYKATDACGNESICSFNLEVKCAQQVTNYCESYGNNAQYTWIHNVQLGGGINNTSGTDWGYGDYTHLATDAECGTELPICLIPGFLNNVYYMYWKIWIDYNQDGDFNDYGELVGYGKCYKKLCGSLPIRSDAQPGETRLRIAMSYGGYPGNPCCKFTYGEVEDYTLNIHCGNSFQQTYVRNDPSESEAIELIEAPDAIAFDLPGDSQFAFEEIYGSNAKLHDFANLEFSIYPNPSSEYVNVDLKQLQGENADFQIFDLSGKVWKSLHVKNASLQKIVQVYIGDLPTGIYELKVSTGDHLYKVEKIIKR